MALRLSRHYRGQIHIFYRVVFVEEGVRELGKGGECPWEVVSWPGMVDETVSLPFYGVGFDRGFWFFLLDNIKFGLIETFFFFTAAMIVIILHK